MRKREQPATQRMEGARQVRDKLINQNLLLVRILSFHYPAHLTRATRGYEGAWNWIACVHFPTGPVSWRLTPDEESLFSHLKREDHPWDRATQAEKLARLADVSSLEGF